MARNRRRRWLVLLGALLVAGGLTVSGLTRGGGPAAGDELGPTVAAQTRDLATTLTASGTLQRSGETTVAYASPIPSAGAAGSSGESAPGSGTGTESLTYPSDPTPSDPSGTEATVTTSGADPTTTTSTSATTTTRPCPTSTSTSSSSTSSSSTTTSGPCPTTSTTSSTTSTTRPGGGSTPSTTTGGTGGGEGEAEGGGGGPGEGDPEGGEGAGPGGEGAEGGAGPGGGGGGEGGEGGGGEVPSATLTGLVDVGTTAARGTVLYTADEQPAVALIGDVPAWRTLEAGVADGADVQQLEENLVALGYGAGLDVDQTFTAGTGAAVQAWETALGRTTPDGTVSIGDVVFLAAPGDVLGHQAEVGDTLDAGSPVLTIGSEQRVVLATVAAVDAGGWAPGATVEVEWTDAATSEGTVLGTGRDVTAGQVELLVAIGPGETGAGDRRSGTAATVTLVDARRDGVLAVPVAALVAADGGSAVRVAQPDGGPDEVVPVETGLVADGWVEITTVSPAGALSPGEEVRLPA